MMFNFQNKKTWYVIDCEDDKKIAIAHFYILDKNNLPLSRKQIILWLLLYR